MKISNFRSIFLSVFRNQLSSLPEKQFAKNYFSQKTSTLYNFFRSWRVKFFLAQNGTSCLSVSRGTILEKHFFGQEKKKSWHLSDIFPSSRPNRSLGCVRTQHSTPPNEQLAGKKFGEIFYFVFLFLRLEDKILFIRGKTEAGCQIVSRRLVRQKGFCG